MNIQQAKIWGAKELKSSPSPQLDCDCLLQFILQKDKTFLLFHRDTVLKDEQQNVFNSLIEKRKTGLPIAYITGKKEFYGRDFIVTEDVLIPKPDTELLVEKSLEVIKEKNGAKPDKIITVCDMCTGSGCVGISILKECIENITENIAVTFVDISTKALDIAKKNAKSLLTEKQYSKVRFIQSNLFEVVGGTFDLIATNPPYIPYSETIELLKDGRNEPVLALNGDVDINGNCTDDNDGLGIIRNLVPEAYSHTAPDGVLLLEAGEYNAEETQKIFINTGFKNTTIFKDMNDQLRDIYGER